MVTKAKKALLASLAAFLCVMLTVFGLSMSVSTVKIAKADDTTAVAKIGEASYAKLSDAVTAAADGNTVTLLKDTTEDVVVDKNITLDLGGKTLTGTKTANKASLTVVKGATATVKNGTILGTENGYYTIQNNGTATFENLTATAGNTGSSMIDNWGTLTINSGEYTGGLNVVKSEEDSKLTINGGKFTLNYSTSGYTGVIFAYGDTTITGGEFIQSVTTCGSWDHPQVVATGVVEGHAATTRVTGGSFTNARSGEGIFRGVGKGTSDNFEVSGGTFNKSVSEEYCANGFIPTKNADGTYGVKEGKYVAKIGSKKYETLADAIRWATKGKTVTLLDNISGNFEISDIKKITLDLNGYTINGGKGTAKAAITNYGTLTITDSSAAKTGTIKRDDSGIVGEKSYYVIQNRGTMTIEQANVVNNSGYRKTNPSGSMVGSSLICNGGNDTKVSTLTINGGEFTQNNFIAIKNDSTAVLNINGGIINSENESAVQNWSTAQILGGTLNGVLWTLTYDETAIGKTVFGGEAVLNGRIYAEKNSQDVTVEPYVSITGGKLNVTEYKVENSEYLKVSGGTFANAVPSEYCADRFIPTQNADGTYGVKACVAKVGSTKYETLAEAIAAAKAGDTITLLANVADFEGAVVTKNLTFDFGDYTITGKTGATVLHVKNAKVTLNGKTGGIDGGAGGDNIAVRADTGAEVIINGGVYTVGADANGLGNSTVYVTDNGKVTINGGTFSSKATYNGKHYVLNVNNSAKGTFEVKGGTFKDFDPLSGDDNLGGNFAPEGYGANRDENENFTIVAGVVAQVKDANGKSVKAYATLEEAVNAAVDGQTVMLLTNVTISKQLKVYKAITLDLNGKTLTSEFKSDSGIYAIVVIGATLTNGTIQVGNARAIGAYGAMIMDGVTVENGIIGGHATIGLSGAGLEYVIRNSTINGAYSVAVFANNATVTIENSNITGRGPALYHNGSNYGLRLTVTDTTLTSAACSVYISGSASMKDQADNRNNADGYQQATFTRCTISGTNGIEVKYTNLTLNSCNISATVKTPTYEQNNNGSTASGFAVVSTDNATGGTTPAPKGTIAVSGEGNYVGAIGIGTLVKNKYEGFEDASYAVSGGKFNHAILPEYCADGFIPTQNADGTFGVKEGAYVAEVKGVKYETLQAAFDAATRNATVTLLANTKENVTIAKALTLDLNGYTINGGKEKRKPAVTVTARTVTIKDSSAAQTGTIMREDTAQNSGVSSHYVIDVQGNSWLVFESGNVKNNSGNDEGKGASLVRVGDDSVAEYPGLNIKGGTFTQNNFIVIKVDRGDLFLNGGTLTSANSYAIENWKRATVKGGTVNGAVSSWTYSGGSNSELTISGGTIKGNVESVSYDGAAGKLAKVSITGGTVTGTLSNKVYNKPGDADKAMATIEVSGGTFKNAVPAEYCAEGFIPQDNGDGTFGVEKTEKVYLAKVGETSYCTMDEAFHAAVATGGTLVLLRDYTTSSVQNSGSNSFTIDLNGHTWTYTGTDTNSAAFEINYSNATLTVKNGTIISSTIVGLIPSAMGGTIMYDNAGLVFEGVEMTSNGSSGIETNGNNTNDSVTLKDSTLNVPNGFGIYFPSSGTLTINNSKINAKTMGVQVCSGKLNINAGSAITVTGDSVPKAENDGAIQDGAAISIVNRGYKGLSNIVITGGTFTAKAGNDAIKAYDWNNAEKTESAFTKADLVAVSGGTFTSAVPAEYCADRFIPTQNEDGTYGVKEGTYVAKIGEVGYETLAEAIAAATDGQTVMLLTRVAENVVIDADKNFTLDLNGFTLNGGTGNKNAAILNHGTLTITDSSAAKTGTIKRDDNGDRGYYVILNLGTMTIEQANVVNNSGHDGSSLIRNGGNDTKVSTLTINGGEFTQNDFIAIKNDSTAVLNINGGIINSENQSAVQNWSTAHILGGTLNGVLWTLTYDETTIGKTVFGGEAVLNGRIYVEKYSQDVTVEPYVSITGGTLNVTKYKVENSEYLKVSGGTFSSEVNKDYLADRFVVNKNTDGTYGVTAGSGFAGANVVVTESLAMKVTIANGTASKYVIVTYKGLDGTDKSAKLETLTNGCYLFDKIMPQMIDVKFSFELYDENDVMLDRKANYSVVDYLADIIASEKDSAAFRNVAASLIEYANRAKTVKGLATIAPEFVKGTEKVDLTELYRTFIADEKNKIPAKDTVKAKDISKGDAQVIYKAKVVFDDAYTLTFYTNDNEKQYTYKLDDKVIVFDENGEYTVNVLAQNITTKYVLTVYDKDSKLVQTVTYGVSTYCIRMQETETPQGELYVASYYYGVAVNQYGTANPNSVQG